MTANFNTLSSLAEVARERSALYAQEAAGVAVSEDVWCALGDAQYRILTAEGRYTREGYVR